MLIVIRFNFFQWFCLSAGNLFGTRAWQVVEGDESYQVDQSSQDQADQEARAGIRKAVAFY